MAIWIHLCALILSSHLLFCLAQEVRPPVEEEDTGGTCSTLFIPQLCDGVGYNNIYLPNFRGHTTQSEAAAELDDYLPLIESGCSPVIRQFLCSYYLPFCFTSPLNGVKRLRPCRSLCEQAISNCSVVLAQNSNLTLPDFLNCSVNTFPCGDGVSCFGTPGPCSVAVTEPPMITTELSMSTNVTVSSPMVSSYKPAAS